MQRALIYDSEGSFTHHMRAPDRTHPSMAPPQDDVHPMWGIHLHFPDQGADGSHTIPHATLEWMCSWHGFDADDTATIINVALHAAHIPDADDVHAWTDPGRIAVMKAIHQDLPDPMHPHMPYAERREVMLARVAAMKEHAVSIAPAPYEDRAGALYARNLAVVEAAAELAEHGLTLPPQYALGLDEQVAEDPLEPVLLTRIDPARIAARRRRDEWIRDRQDAAVDRALVAMRSPMTFGVVRQMPPPVSSLLDALKPMGKRG